MLLAELSNKPTLTRREEKQLRDLQAREKAIRAQEVVLAQDAVKLEEVGHSNRFNLHYQHQRAHLGEANVELNQFIAKRLGDIKETSAQEVIQEYLEEEEKQRKKAQAQERQSL